MWDVPGIILDDGCMSDCAGVVAALREPPPERRDAHQVLALALLKDVHAEDVAQLAGAGQAASRNPTTMHSPGETCREGGREGGAPQTELATGGGEWVGTELEA